MKYNFLKMSFTLLLALNYSSLVQAQSSLIPSSIDTPTTNNGNILIIQKGKPTLTYQSYSDGEDISINTQELNSNASTSKFNDPTAFNPNLPRELRADTPYIPQTSQSNTNDNNINGTDNNHGVIIGMPVAITPSTNSNTPKTYVDDNDTDTEESYQEDNNSSMEQDTPRLLVPSSNYPHDATTTDSDDTDASANQNLITDPDLRPIPGPAPFDNRPKEFRSNSMPIIVDEDEEESWNEYSEERINYIEQKRKEYSNNQDKNTGLLSESILSQEDSEIEASIVGIKEENNDSNTNEIFKDSKFGFFSIYDVPTQKHNLKDGE